MKLQELEEAIAETRKRLPAHSVKPPVMMDLLDLEDQRDEFLAKLSK
ncbi:MAG: histidine kinase [Deltaproteobacteria bacterium]|nr:histidine kinase [Deltaproteobacteria bacterium]